MRRRWLSAVVAGVILAMGLGCAAHQVKEKWPVSGFLGDYSQLQPGEEGEANLAYYKPGVASKAYNKVTIDPVLVWLHVDADSIAIDPAQMKALTDAFHQALVNALQYGYTIVDAPGPGVLRIRTAITDVVAGKPVRETMSSLLPLGIAASGAVRAATGTYPFVGQAGMEMEVLDDRNERIIAVVDRRTGPKGPFRSEYKDARNAFDYWAEQVRFRLEQARAIP